MDYDLTGGRLKSNLTMTDVLGHIFIWLILTLITAGIALLFYPYALAKLILNSTILEDRKGLVVGKFKCDLSAGSQVGHMLLWLLIIVVTVGIAYPFYFFGIYRTAINKTVLIP